MNVPEMTIMRVGKSILFRAAPGKLTTEEVVSYFGSDPDRTEVVLQEYSYGFPEGDEGLLKLAELMFRRGVEWARNRTHEELGGDL